MYNKIQKVSFIKDVSKSISAADFYTELFNRTEPFECEWEKDICEANEKELREFFNSIGGWKSTGDKKIKQSISTYVRWCAKQQTVAFSDAINKFDSNLETRAKECLVPNPIGLQIELDKVFNPEDRHDSDIIYRCAYWLIFSGIDPSMIGAVRRKDVCFDNMSIVFRDASYPIYRESIPTIINAASLNCFYYDNPIYGNAIERERSDNVHLIAGIRSIPTQDMISLRYRNCCAKAREEGINAKSLTLERVYTSGIFYRAFESERAGITHDFLELIRRDTIKYFPDLETAELDKKVISKIKRYEKEYDTWKKAFLV